jgi:hypothetical protein
MQKVWVLISSLLISSFIYANGVSICNATTGVFLTMKSSKVTVNVESQVAVVKVDQVFMNNLAADT